MNYTYLPYNATGYFSKLVTDYLCTKEEIAPFYKYTPGITGINSAIEDRSKYPVDRKTLSGILRKQYENLPLHEAVQHNISLLEQENTFTVCTAHQPNLLTGYLYFIYKIVHAIKLAHELKVLHPDKNFVPVYYMGSEDNDLDELGTFRYGGKKFVWTAAGQTGAVGRMDTASLKPLFDELFKLLGPPGNNCDDLKNIITTSYLQHKTVAHATQYLVNELFGRYGLLVLDPDEAAFKAAFVKVMEDDLLNHTAYSVTSAQIEKLEVHYKSQAHPRPVNLFYLKDNLRERIEKKGDEWIVLNTGISFSKEEIIKELHTYPERFSPNVILRGLFQETIMPNVAFIGGGAEVAYWLQLKTLFEHYNVFYPVILLRQSVLWIEPAASRRLQQMDMPITGIFKDESLMLREYITRHSTANWQTTDELRAAEQLMDSLKTKATALDPTLKASAEAALTKIKYQLQVLEKKMLKAEKRKMQESVLRITKLKQELFPSGSLQERSENFAGYYLQYGKEYIDTLYDAIAPLRNDFLVIQADTKN